MSVNITSPALSSLLFEHCNADGDREGFLLGNVIKVVTNTISDADINVVKHEIVYNIYSFVPVYGISKWYDRNGAVVENALAALLQDVNSKEIIGWYKLRRNSSMQVSMREHAVHSSFSRWIQRTGYSHAVLFMLCVSPSATNSPLYLCDHQYMIASGIGGYECLPETVISLAGIAQPNYKLSAICISSEQCTYNRVLNKSSRAFVDTTSEPVIVCEISRLSDRLRQKLKTLSGSVLDTEEQVSKELSEVRLLRKQLEERRDALASFADDAPLLKVSGDTGLPCATASNTQPIIFDSDGSEDMTLTDTLSQPLQASSRDCNEDIMLLDTGDEASSLQVPCLIPELVMPSSSLLSQNDGQQTSSTFGIPVDGNMDVCSASLVTVTADMPNGSIEKSVESRPFDFVNDVMRSCSPNRSNKSAILRSIPAVRGEELTAAEFDSSKA